MPGAPPQDLRAAHIRLLPTPDTEPAPLPLGTAMRGPPGPELPTGLIKVTAEMVPILPDSLLTQVAKSRARGGLARCHLGVSPGALTLVGTLSRWLRF